MHGFDICCECNKKGVLTTMVVDFMDVDATIPWFRLEFFVIASPLASCLSIAIWSYTEKSEQCDERRAG